MSREPEVHVVVVQSQENGKVNAKVLRETYTTIRKGDAKTGSSKYRYVINQNSLVFING